MDLRLGTADGLDLIPALLAANPWLKIIVITAYASVESAVEAMRRGATDYLPKPFTPAQVELATRKVMEVRTLEQKVADLQEYVGRSHPEIDFSTRSHVMQRALNLARQAAPTDATILLQGESGAGKTLLARGIHTWSKRAEKSLGIVSCPSLSAELLESELFGHSRALSPVRCATIQAGSPRVREELFSWTRSAISHCRFSQSSFVSCRTKSMKE